MEASHAWFHVVLERNFEITIYTIVKFYPNVGGTIYHIVKFDRSRTSSVRSDDGRT